MVMPIPASRTAEILPIDSPRIRPKEVPAGGGGGGGGAIEGRVGLTVVMAAPQQPWRAILIVGKLLLTIETSRSVGKGIQSEPGGKLENE